MWPIPIITSSVTVPLNRFWDALVVYHDKPHTVNRKLGGIVQLSFFELISAKINGVYDWFTRSGILYEVRKLKDISSESITDDFIKSFIEPYDNNFELRKSNLDDLQSSDSGIFISLRILLSRIKGHKNCVEIVILSKKDNKAVFHSVSVDQDKAVAPQFPYAIECMNSGHVRIVLENIEDCESNSANWLCESVFIKILKWAENLEDNPNRIESLSLIDVEQYYKLYHSLKAKYSQALINIWTENTDPKKFVHEDLAIASYLICLMSKDQTEKKPSFVDLGCGNGLLVYILNKEGYPGSGIDVRKRKIWDQYPSEVKLEVKTIVPSAQYLFPEADWIIGNHSDELTPWIPVIALRSSPTTNFFVLPCCPYDFNGRKYMRLNTSISQYSEYLDYVKSISELCGFKTDIDKLKIPSTKRVCIVGNGHTFKSESFSEVDQKVQEFINHRCGKETYLAIECWANDFSPRSSTEVVRNCTQLNRDFVNQLILKIVQLLLQKNDYISKYDGSKWNIGGNISFSDLPKLLTNEDLKELKNECGGIKTLLKNHRYLFVVKKNEFSLRKPLSKLESTKYVDKPCWFFANHPDGCLFSSDECGCKHL